MVGGTLGPRQVGPLLGEILATCLLNLKNMVLKVGLLRRRREILRF